jgi:DNA-binding transcriptional regulator YdaS (Cro superfamily)
MDFKSWVSEKRGRSITVARAIGVPPSFVSKIVKGQKAIPAEHCKAIFSLSGGVVTVQEMRPKDWQKYWPELDQAPVNTAQTAMQSVANVN